jgi:hypothetical protein
VYVASSWRNPLQADAVSALRAAGISTYDYRHPFGGSKGFGWHEVGSPHPQGAHQPVSPDVYLDMIAHPRADEAYHDNDLAAMHWCSHLIMVLPCGRSAHAEAGWAAGMGKHTAVWLAEDPMEPELMYKMFEFMTPSLPDIIEWVMET